MSITTADVLISRQLFLDDRQGRTFADVVNDPEQPFEQVLAFFNDADRQRRMEESEIHHNRPPLAGVVREFEASSRRGSVSGIATPPAHEATAAGGGRCGPHDHGVARLAQDRQERIARRSRRSRASFGHAGRIPQHGWIGILVFAGRTIRGPEGMPFRTVRARRNEFDAAPARKSPKRKPSKD